MSPNDPSDSNDPNEVDIDLEFEPDEGLEMLDAAEYLGDYASIEAYLRATLESEISPCLTWLLDCLDMDQVLAHFESDGSRLTVQDGKVFRVS